MASKSNEQKKGDDYPNIIEEPIRVVGESPRGKSKLSRSKKQALKRSGKTVAKKPGKK